MGGAKDRLLDGAKSAAGEALHTVEEKVDEMAAPAAAEPKNPLVGPGGSALWWPATWLVLSRRSRRRR